MAKTVGTGQGRVRAFRQGRMAKCSDPGCQRAARMVGFVRGEYVWNCGQAPLLPKVKDTRRGR